MGSNKYKKELYFDPEADSSTGADYFISDGELRSTLREVIDTTEKIDEVRYYTNPLSEIQYTKYLLHHAYIVLETDKWWWSIEKNSERVTIQRSKKLKYVRDKYQRKDRTTSLTSKITLETKATGIRTMNELIDHLYVKDYLNQEYDFATYNCKHLADLIYYFLTEQHPTYAVRLLRLNLNLIFNYSQ